MDASGTCAPLDCGCIGQNKQFIETSEKTLIDSDHRRNRASKKLQILLEVTIFAAWPSMCTDADC